MALGRRRSHLRLTRNAAIATRRTAVSERCNHATCTRKNQLCREGLRGNGARRMVVSCWCSRAHWTKKSKCRRKDPRGNSSRWTAISEVCSQAPSIKKSQFRRKDLHGNGARRTTVSEWCGQAPCAKKSQFRRKDLRSNGSRWTAISDLRGNGAGAEERHSSTGRTMLWQSLWPHLTRNSLPQGSWNLGHPILLKGERSVNQTAVSVWKNRHRTLAYHAATAALVRIAARSFPGVQYAAMMLSLG